MSTFSENMDQAFRFGYSTKNIPIPSQKEFKLQLIHSVRKFFDNICWRLEFIKNPVEKNEEKKTFDFKSIKAVPRHEELEPMQEALYDLIENIKFRKYNDPFQSKLKKDLEDIKNEVDFIDITLNMKNDTFKPFHKPNDKPEYVNKLSNHPPEILKNIPIGINKRLVSISASKEVFENATQIYSDELVKCGYDHTLFFFYKNQ